jgi:hypothetical protein
MEKGHPDGMALLFLSKSGKIQPSLQVVRFRRRSKQSFMPIFIDTTKYEKGGRMAAIHHIISPFRKKEVRRDFPNAEGNFQSAFSK